MVSRSVIMSLVILVAGIALGVAFSFVYSQFQESTEDTAVANVVDRTSLNYEVGFNDARILVEESNLKNLFVTEDTSVSGVVTAIEGNRLTIYSESITNPFLGEVSNDKVITVEEGTRIIRFVQNDAEAKTNSAKDTQNTPRFSVVTVTFSDILVGDSLTVTAKEGTEVSAEFVAQEIQLLSRGVTQ